MKRDASFPSGGGGYWLYSSARPAAASTEPIPDAVAAGRDSEKAIATHLDVRLAHASTEEARGTGNPGGGPPYLPQITGQGVPQSRVFKKQLRGSRIFKPVPSFSQSIGRNRITILTPGSNWYRPLLDVNGRLDVEKKASASHARGPLLQEDLGRGTGRPQQTGPGVYRRCAPRGPRGFRMPRPNLELAQGLAHLKRISSTMPGQPTGVDGCARAETRRVAAEQPKT